MGEKYKKFVKKQEEFSKKNEEKNPSEETEFFWIVSTNNNIDYPLDTPQSGKWLIFVHKSQIDQVWKKVKAALKNGELGRSAKVSTRRPSPFAADPDTHVICIYTYDSDDIADVQKIRQKLRELGVLQKIPYKTDQATREGKYIIHGYERIYKYFE